MMKVGILTFPNSTSYGASLQMYALYKKVNELGHDAEVINYFNSFMKAEKHCINNSGLAFKDAVKRSVKRALHSRLKQAFLDFEKNKVRLYPRKPVSEKPALFDIGKRYDAVICGSDQVWNPEITDRDLSYFLDFCGTGTRRISYAPSFGIDKFSDDFSDLIRSDIGKFDALSVRENSGREYIKKEFGIDATIVCDPTMLLSAEDWSEIEEYCPLVKDDYILYYTIRRSDVLMNYCRELSKKTGLKIVIVGGNFIKKLKNKDRNVKYATDISPAQWLYLVHNAKYVVTNSFHGTAFSIIFKRDFYIELSSLTNSRLANITNKFSLSDRIVCHSNCLHPTSCNYEKAENTLSELSSDSIEFLKKALRKE
jgi:hypothetical protein